MFQAKVRFLTWFPAHEKRITLSTWITIARIAMTPLIVVAMIFGYWSKACALFVLASVSDFLDGNIARWRNEQTLLGACLDPVADKILLLSCFFTLAFAPSPLFHLPLWFVLIILVRELIVILGVVVLYFLKGAVQVEPTITSKLTTLMQVIFILWIFACYFFNWVPIKTYYALLAMVTVLVLVSLVQYMRIGIMSFYQSAS